MDSTKKINNLENSYLEKIIKTPFFQRINQSEINFINKKIEEMDSKEFKEIRTILNGFYHDRDYCRSRGIEYSSLKELSNISTKEEVIADAYRLYYNPSNNYLK